MLFMESEKSNKENLQIDGQIGRSHGRIVFVERMCADKGSGNDFSNEYSWLHEVGNRGGEVECSDVVFEIVTLVQYGGVFTAG